jgi:hypothetical protein
LLPAGPQPERRSAPARASAAQPDEARLLADVGALARFGTRFAGSRQTPAVLDWLRGRMAESGLAVEEESFPLRVGLRETVQINLFAQVPGRDPARPGLLLLAHYDSINEGWAGEKASLADPETPAPGAGDNGSGVAVLLETARLLAASAPERPVAFLFSAAEEMGQAGSRHYARAEAGRLSGLAWVVNVDQIGCSRSGPLAMQLFTRDQGIPLAWRLQDIAREACPEILSWRLHLDDRLGKSDHGPFLDAGLMAASLSEGPGYYPWEAQGAGDAPERLDIRLMSLAVRLLTATARDPDLPLPAASTPRG